MDKETEFIIFCMESYKVHKGIKGKEVYKLFETYDVFGYLEEFYDILHTTGYDYINNDIDIFIKNRQTH